MVRKLFALLKVLGRAIVIECDAPTWYLGRIYLWDSFRKRLPGVFLHRFFASDGDRELHNHPWEWAYSLVLTGGYWEEILQNGKITWTKQLPGSVHRIDANTFHRVKLFDETKGCWTLFVAGPRLQEWGFIDLETKRFETHRQRELRRKAENATLVLEMVERLSDAWPKGMTDRLAFGVYLGAAIVLRKRILRADGHEATRRDWMQSCALAWEGSEESADERAREVSS